MFSRVFSALSLFVATISSFGQDARVRLIDGQWRDIEPSKTVTRFAGGEGLRDPLFSRQEEMFQKTGMLRLWSERGTSISRIRGAPVVIMDTGVEASHPDLAGRLDCAASQTFIEGGGDPCRDEWGHGTAVASIGFANGEDRVGMRGFAWNSPLISYKVMVSETNEFGQARLRISLDAIIKAFRALKEVAEVEGMVIVVTSFSIDGVDPVLNGLLKELEEQGRVLIVAATDNVVLDSETLPGLPCAASVRSNVLCVASLTMQGNLAAWSAYGKRVNHTARCESIVASYPGPRYGTFTGNSGCAPQIVALASLLFGYTEERGVLLAASTLKDLLLKGGVFAPGLVSAIRQQEILYPITLDAYKLFDLVDEFLAYGEALKFLTNETVKVSGVTNGTSPVTSELKVGLHYRVAAEGFRGEQVLFLNGVRIEAVFASDSAEFILGPEASFFGGGYNNVLYLARESGGEVDPFSVVKVLSGFQIR